MPQALREIPIKRNRRVDVKAAVTNGLLAHALEYAGEVRREELMAYAEDDAGRIIAGGWGKLQYGRLFVEGLWVDETRRGLGLGTVLLRDLEAQARKKGAHGARVNTADFQALEFYLKNGYEVMARLPVWFGRPPYEETHTDYYLNKEFGTGPEPSCGEEPPAR